jgi:dihydroxyacid dehydratase/phosphogluconate dehydratase
VERGGIVVLRGNLAPDGAVLKPSAASQYENAILVDPQVGVVDPLLAVFDILEYHSASAMPH